MSAAIVRQALEIVDPEQYQPKKGVKRKSKPEALSAFPEKRKSIGKTYNIKDTREVIGLPVSRKYTVQDAKKKLKSSKEILENNLRKLELIRNHSTITLDDNLTKSIIQRAVSRRPVGLEKNKHKESKTAFTEEDFKKFEEEYLNTPD